MNLDLSFIFIFLFHSHLLIIIHLISKEVTIFFSVRPSEFQKDVGIINGFVTAEGLYL